MTVSPNPGWLSRIFERVIAHRWVVLIAYALLLVPSAYFAARVGQDNSIDRLIVASDPDYIDTRAFEQVFGAGEYAIIVAEAADPFASDVVTRLDSLERRLLTIPHVEANSALSIFRRVKAGFEPTPEQISRFRAFATGTSLLAQQGMVGEHFLAIALVLDVHGSEERHAALSAIDAAIAADGETPGLRMSTLGLPYVDRYLDESQRSVPAYFLLFAAFVVLLNVSLYRSVRTLLAFLVTLGVCLAMSMGYIGITGGMLTIVSPMVPMTILVTATATLVYLHSRFVDCPVDRPVEVHRILALENKFVACTASIFATGVGFGALTISSIRPIRQMGIWVAVGLGLTWIVVFTLFPALQKILRTPTRCEQRPNGERFDTFAAWLPRFTYRWRWLFVGGAVGLSIIGAVALFGVPGLVEPMHIQTNPLEYMQPDSVLYKDIQRLTPLIPGTSVTQVWLKGKVGSIAEPEVLTGLHDFQQALEQDRQAGVGAVIGPTNILRLLRYIGGAGDTWPTDSEAVDGLAEDLERLVPLDPMLQRFVQPHSLAQTQLTVVSRSLERAGYVALNAAIRRHWQEVTARHPALRPFEMKIVGLAPLHAKMAQELVPTLVQSFTLTVGIVFATFLIVFRSGSARLMAMIPSLFAILVMFGVMRLIGTSLNIATILIASTVLGTSENDQIHFFYHFLERRSGASVEAALRHTLLIAGRAICYATLINAGGFLAFTLADLPAVRQFGFLSATALVLSMLADFTALPAALWILSGERPDDTGADRR